MSAVQRLRAPLLTLGLVASLTLAACAPATRVILLPDTSGRTTAVTVSSPQSNQVLDKAYERADVSRGGAIEAGQTTAEKVAKTHGDLLRLTPAAADQFQLQFVTGGAMLTPESESQLSTILERATARAGGEIFVTGHTDTTGTDELNDRLSLERANTIRDLIIGRDFPAERVYAIGRGSRQPLVPTGPGVDEPRNRRVDITVR